MKKFKKPVKIKRREITLILVSIMVLILFFSGYSMGKEYSSIKLDTNAKIAEPILIVENSPTLQIDGKKQNEYYDFKIKNYKENGPITEIDLQYNIEIIAPKEEAIFYRLYKDNQEVMLKENKTGNMKLNKENLQEDCYQLEIIYDKTKAKTQKDILQEVQIKVHSEQLKS